MNNAMNNVSNIEKIVMRRIYTIRVLRLTFSNSALALAALGVTLFAIGRAVWVARVFANGPASILGNVQYFIYAFVHTEFLVQALSLFALAATIILARETARLLTGLFLGYFSISR